MRPAMRGSVVRSASAPPGGASATSPVAKRMNGMARELRLVTTISPSSPGRAGRPPASSSSTRACCQCTRQRPAASSLAISPTPCEPYSSTSGASKAEPTARRWKS